MIKILFICLGNICRSPIAEYVFIHIAQERGIHNIHADSAGPSGWHAGEFMHCGAADILDGLGIDSHDFVSQKVPTDALDKYDYLIVMDEANLHDVRRLLGESDKIFKITDVLPENTHYDHVPDPWYTGNFNETHTIVSQCCEILLERLARGDTPVQAA